MSELALKLIKEAKEKRLTRLDLGNCGLTELPDELFELVWLEELFLCNQGSIWNSKKKDWKPFISTNKGQINNIISLSPNICQLQNLKTFKLNGGNEVAFDIEDLSSLNKLKNLVHLDISFTHVYDLTPVRNLVNLKQLYVNHTLVDNIDSIRFLKNIRQLDLGYTKVSNISPLSKITNIELLYLSKTEISNLESLNNLDKLRYLSFSETQVKDISPLKNLIKLELIDAAGTKITSLQPVKDLIYLRKINVSNNGIDDLMPLSNLVKLEVLNSFNTNISSIDSVHGLVNLLHLNISQTIVSDLTPLKNITKLETIDIFDTEISDLTPLKNHIKLKNIDIRYTCITNLIPIQNLLSSNNLSVLWCNEALELIKKAKGEFQTKIDLGLCSLKVLPDELFELTWLEELSLSNNAMLFSFEENRWIQFISDNNGGINNLKEISPKIEALHNLKKLVLSGSDFLRGKNETIWISGKRWEINDLTVLNKLQKLTELYLDYTQIFNLEPLEKLYKLNVLSIHNTFVKDLNPIERLTALQALNVSWCKEIHDLSPLKDLKKMQSLRFGQTNAGNLNELRSLINLQEISFAQTKVNDISSLKELLKLRKIDAYQTPINDLSPLKDLYKLQEIDVSHCPIINPPKAIIEQGSDAIIRYLKELRDKESSINNQTKLIFVGNSRAGKTSLWQFLKDKVYNEQADSTHGIKTEIWDTEPLGTEGNQNLAAHIWDFGGQEYYHATHRLFLADNAVYVLVWEKESNKQGTRLEKFKLDDDPNSEIEEVDLEHFPASYWLENIKYFAGKHCPVLIVQNKVDEEALKGNYTEGVQEVNDCFHLSIQNAYGFQEGNATLKRHDLKFQDFKERLLELLRKNATAFKLVKYYAQVREALEAKAKDTEYIAVSELKDIALQFDETPDLENLLAYLKSFTNTVLYFPQNEVLKDRLYLNPTHISRDIYKILNKTVRENNGKFDLAHIKIRLNLNDDNETERFVALMKEFDLIFEKSKTIKGEIKRQFITPQYLPKKEDLSDDIQLLIEGNSFETAFIIQFKSFVPRSLMLRFIAENGALSNQETYWRNGIIYKSPTTQSMIKVEYDHDQSTFTTQVQDKQKQTIDMQNIVEQFVKLENSDQNIKISNDGKLYVDLRTIRKLQHENRREDIYTDGNIISLKEYNWLITKQKTEVSMTLEELKNQVRTLISKAKTKDAMDAVATWAHENNQEQLKDDINLLKGELTTLSRNTTLGLVSHSEAVTQQNQLNNKVLNLLNSINENDSDNKKLKNVVMNEFDLTESDKRVIIAIGSFGFKPNDRLVMEKSGLIHKEFQDSLANLKNQEIAYISNDGNQRKIETLVNFHNAHRLIKKEEKERSKVNHNTKPAIYFSYAWGDDNEEGESREKIVQELYESLKMDGYNVVRDKEDVGYKGSISDFMKTIGKGNSIIVAISDKYLKSENCMFEMYEIFRNAKLEKEGFIEKIYPIRIESIRLSDPLVLDTYFEHWEKKEKDWEQLIVKRGTRISSEQQEQYRRIKAIAHELGDFLAFLNDINAKTKADLSKNNFEEIKKAITKRVIF